MTATLTRPARHLDSERDRLRRRRDRHARLATDRAMTEVAFTLRAGERRDREMRDAAPAGRRQRVPPFAS